MYAIPRLREASANGHQAQFPGVGWRLFVHLSFRQPNRNARPGDQANVADEVRHDVERMSLALYAECSGFE